MAMANESNENSRLSHQNHMSYEEENRYCIR